MPRPVLHSLDLVKHGMFDDERAGRCDVVEEKRCDVEEEGVCKGKVEDRMDSEWNGQDFLRGRRRITYGFEMLSAAVPGSLATTAPHRGWAAA